MRAEQYLEQSRTLNISLLLYQLVVRKCLMADVHTIDQLKDFVYMQTERMGETFSIDDDDDEEADERDEDEQEEVQEVDEVGECSEEEEEPDNVGTINVHEIIDVETNENVVPNKNAVIYRLRRIFMYHVFYTYIHQTLLYFY